MIPREQLAAEFRNTLYLIWKYSIKGSPDPTLIQYDIASFLADPSEDRIIIEGFRGVGKSYITSAFCIQQYLRDPNVRVLVVSASKARADKFAKFVKGLIHNVPEFHYLRPGKDQRDATNNFDVGPAINNHAPSMLSLGITSQLVGNRADIIIADDVETTSNSLTQTTRDSLREAVKEFESILSPGGRIIYLGTPQYQDSLYNELRNYGYTCRIWPARYPSQRQLEGYEGCLAPTIADALRANLKLEGIPTDPKRFNDVELLKREASLGKSTFQLQFMLDTTLSDQERFPLKISDLILMPLAPEVGPMSVGWSSDPCYIANEMPSPGFAGDLWHRSMSFNKDTLPYDGSVMAIDPAGKGGDEVGYAVVKLLNGRLFVTAADGLPGGYADGNLKHLAMVAKYQKVNQIIVEANMGDGMFTQLLKPFLLKYHPCSIEEKHSTIQKERRIIDVLEPILNQHRLVVSEDVAVNDYRNNRDKKHLQLFWQMTHITRERGSLNKDDRLDALAQAVAFWVEAMARDADKAAEEARDEWLERQAQEMEDRLFYSQKPSNSWLHF